MLEEIAEPSEEKPDEGVERWEDEGGSCSYERESEKQTKQKDDNYGDK